MHTEVRRAVGTAVLLLPLLASHPAAAQFASPTGATTAPVPVPDAASSARDTTRREIVGGRADSVLRPVDVGRLRDLMLDAQGATAYPNYGGQALPAPRRLNISYAPAPDRPPEALHLWRGVATSLTFIDEQGKPWPIEAVVYDRRLFSMNGQGCTEDGGTQPQAAEDDKERKQPSTFFMVPCKHWTWGSFSVQLRGQIIPITFMATSGGPENGGQPVVDVPVVLTVAKPPGKPTPAAKPAPPAPRRPAPSDKIARHTGSQEASQ